MNRPRWFLEAGCRRRVAGCARVVAEDLLSHRDLATWQLARTRVVDAYKLSANALPKFERFEMGGPIRRAVNSVKACMVEGCGGRRYKQKYPNLLACTRASHEATLDQMETPLATGYLTDTARFEELRARREALGRLNLFIQSVELIHHSARNNRPAPGQDTRALTGSRRPPPAARHRIAP